eukprot:16164042-Heterocapsa_arctica.AAC.1
MSSTRIHEPSNLSRLPLMGASDAKWIAALHHHQEKFANCHELAAVVYKVAIYLLTDSLYLAVDADSTLIEAEKARREADRAL